MAGITLPHLDNIESQTSFLQALNERLDTIADAVNSKLSRDDVTLGQMDVSIDMNGSNVHNLGPPTSSTDAARWIDVYSAGTFTDYVMPSLLGNANKYLRVTADSLGLYWSDSSGGLVPSNNLSDLTNPAAARTNLGLGTAASYDIGASGSRVPLLGNTNTWGGAQTWQSPGTFTAGGSFTGAAEWRVQTTGATSLSSDSVGYRGAPQNIQDAAYTFVMDDMGKGVTHTSATPHAWTIPPDSLVNFPIHTVIICDNFGAGSVTITRGGGVHLSVNGSGTSADFVLAQYNVRSLYKIGPNFWKVI
jgi:hypothetical protein